MRPKVCFLGGTRYSRPLNLTAEKKFTRLAEVADVFVVGFSPDLFPRRFTQHARFYTLPLFRLPLLRYAEMATVGLLLVLWCVCRHGVRVVVAQSPYEGCIAAWAKGVARLFGRRLALVIENHGDFETTLFMERRLLWPGLYRFLMRRFAGFALRRADLLRAVSDSTRRQLHEWEPHKPVHQFPAWTDIGAFFREGASRMAGPGQDVLYAGVLIPRKGVHHLLAAFAAVAGDFPAARVLVAGREENKDYAAGLKAQVEQVGLGGRVEFLGELSQEQLAAGMRQAALFVLPSYSEGLPRVVFEAMAAGLPVVATAVSGNPEIIEEGKTGFLVPPGDEAALADRLRWALGHPTEAQAVGHRARAFAQSIFSEDGYVRAYRDLFGAAGRMAPEVRRRRATAAV